MPVPQVARALGSALTWWCTSASTQVRGPSRVLSAAAASVTAQTSRSTGAHTQVRNPTAVSCAASASHASPTSMCTGATMLATSPTSALSVARPSVWVPSWHCTARRTWASGQRNVRSVANVLATAAPCHSTSELTGVLVPPLLLLPLPLSPRQALHSSLPGKQDRKSQGFFVSVERDLLRLLWGGLDKHSYNATGTVGQLADRGLWKDSMAYHLSPSVSIELHLASRRAPTSM